MVQKRAREMDYPRQAMLAQKTALRAIWYSSLTGTFNSSSIGQSMTMKVLRALEQEIQRTVSLKMRH